ncbi:MAG: hypothetical protein QOE09_753 [Ilumatobacteraceae bacterium]|jgi:hypothetical protein
MLPDKSAQQMIADATLFGARVLAPGRARSPVPDQATFGGLRRGWCQLPRVPSMVSRMMSAWPA